MHISAETEKKLMKEFNILDLVGVIVVLVVALVFQFVLKEMPCPLCLLQRFGFSLMAFGLLLNLTFDFKPSHYAISGLGAMFTMATGLRQMLLHVVPGSGSYGGAIFGMHLYTWSLIVASLFLLVMLLSLLLNRQFGIFVVKQPTHHPHMVMVLNVIFILLLAINVVSIFLECGFDFCPANPVDYIY